MFASITAVTEYLQSPWLGLLLAVIGILLGAIGVVLTIRSRSKARLVYQSRDLVLIGQPDANPAGEIKILFNDAMVPRVVVTRLAVWNAGNTTIKRDDIVFSDPLAVCFDSDVMILGSRRLKASQTVNDFRLKIQEQDRSRAVLEFDYLNNGDGAVFEIVHTGARGGVSVTGSVRGISRGVENWGYLQGWEEQKSRLTGTFNGLLIWGALIATLISFSWLEDTVAPRHPALALLMERIIVGAISLVALFIGLVIVVVTVYSLRTRARRAPKTLSGI